MEATGTGTVVEVVVLVVVVGTEVAVVDVTGTADENVEVVVELEVAEELDTQPPSAKPAHKITLRLAPFITHAPLGNKSGQKPPER